MRKKRWHIDGIYTYKLFVLLFDIYLYSFTVGLHAYIYKNNLLK